VRINSIRRVSVAVGLAILAAVALGASSAAVATAATGTDPTVSAPSDKGGTIDKGKKGELVTQEGVVTSPVTTGGKGKGDGEVTAFKVTNDGHTQPWVVTPKTIVVKDGKVVPPSAIAKGDHVTVTGTVEKGTLGQAAKVVIHGDDGDDSKGDNSHDG
jgi:hypothetical protein